MTASPYGLAGLTGSVPHQPAPAAPSTLASGDQETARAAPRPLALGGNDRLIPRHAHRQLGAICDATDKIARLLDAPAAAHLLAHWYPTTLPGLLDDDPELVDALLAWWADPDDPAPSAHLQAGNKAASPSPRRLAQ